MITFFESIKCYIKLVSMCHCSGLKDEFYGVLSKYEAIKTTVLGI